MRNPAKPGRSRTARVAAGLAVASASAAALGGSAVASTASASAKVYACYSNSTGEMFRVTASTTCPSGRTKIDWAVQGPQGARGAQGAQGAKGPQGAAGSAGSRGAQGSMGAQGSQGAQGASGAPGAQGSKGGPGAQGAVGAQGAAGPQGFAGPPGARGAQGTRGARGVTGPQGVTGPPGPGPTVNEYNFEASSGSVMIGGSGSAVVATVTPAPGIYNVTATATGFNGGIACRVGAVNSVSSVFSATAIGRGGEDQTAAETGLMSVQSLSVIKEICTGGSGTGVVHRALTAVEVTNATGTVSHSVRGHHVKVPARPVNRFVGGARHAQRAARAGGRSRR